MRRSFITLVCLAVLVSAAFAAPAVPAASKEPLKIKSDTLHADNEKKTATFEGKVVARQGDLTLSTDRLVISYAGDGKELSRVEAFGSVRIVQGTRQASGGHAIYEPKLERIILDGSPRVTEGNNVITGSQVVYYVNQQKSEVIGGPGGRVEAVIEPGGKHVGSKP